MAEFLQQPQQTPVVPPSTASAISSAPSGVPGVLHEGVFWTWQQDVSSQSTQARLGHQIAGRWIKLVAWLAAASALLVFLYYTLAQLQLDLFVSETWLNYRPAIFAFWLMWLILGFIFFRAFEARTKDKTIPKKTQEVPLEVTHLPSLEVVERVAEIAQVATPELLTAVEEGFDLAQQGGHAQVTAEHLFVGAITTKSIRMLFMRMGITFDQMKDALRRKMQTYPTGTTTFGLEARELLAAAFKDAKENGRLKVSAIELFAQTYYQSEYLQELMYSIEVEREELENVIAWVRINDQISERYQQFRKAAALKPTGPVNRAYTSVQTTFLDQVSRDLTRAAVAGNLPILIGRERELEETLRAIESGQRSVVLVGPTGVGKQAIIAGIAERMTEERVPKIMQDKRLVQLSVPHIISAQGGSGAEERLLVALQEVGISGNIVLVIENIHQLVGGFAQGIDLSPVLTSELEKRYTFVIATATPEGYTKQVERSILAQYFNKVDVPEPERNDAIQVLESKIAGIENVNKVVFTYPAVRDLVDLSDRYLHETYLPEKAILLAQELGTVVGNKSQDWSQVTEKDVASLISTKTQVPVTDVTQEEGEKLLNLEEKMHERLIGQNEAVKAVASALRRARVELRAENRPIANFLFLGPTGVGKTELAKTTAEAYFGNEESMLRFDMSEYQDKSAIYKLIGGAGETGLLTEAVRKNPFCLLLLDELEKAHPDILNVFLQVMDDGRLTDGEGRTIDFTNVILIATSNAGTQYIMDETAAGTDLEAIKTHLMEEELKQIYRPEFLNRFDGVIVFKPLSEEDVVAIAYLQIEKVAKRLEAKGIIFRATDEAVHELAEKGYDPKFGARPLRRVIQENVDNAIADYLLKGKVGRRDTLVLDAGGQIAVEKAAEL